MQTRFSSSLLAGLWAVLAAGPAPAKDAAPSAKSPATAQTLPTDPGNVLNKLASGLPAPNTLPDGAVVGIGYWSYVDSNASPRRYCVEPKVFSCSKVQGPQTWSVPATLELVDASGTPIKSVVLSQPMPPAMINTPATKPDGLVVSAGSLAQWCVGVAGLGPTSFPNWKLRLGNKTHPVEWNPNKSVAKASSPKQSPC